MSLIHRKRTVAIEVKQGKGVHHRWRWTARDRDGDAIAVSPPHGYDTETDALNAARAIFNSDWHKV